MTARKAILTDYQREIFKDPARAVFAIKARGIGGTFAFSLRAACRALGVDLITGKTFPPRNQIVCSASQRQSNEFLLECAGHLRVIDSAGRALGIGVLDGEPGATQIRLSNGMRIVALPARPASLRAWRGDLILDEFGVMPHAKEIYQAGKPVADANLKNAEGSIVDVLGTPCGDDNLFHEIATGAKGYEHFSKHRVDIYRAHRDGFPVDIDKLRSEVDSDTFEQEYNCSFLSASTRYISAELYDRSVYYEGDVPKGQYPARYVGYDVARKASGDFAVLMEVDLIGDTLWCVPCPEYARRGVSWEDQEEWMAQAMERDCRRACVDATGMGDMYAERLGKRFGSRVEPVTFTAPIKETLATGLRLALERGRLRLPDDPDLRRDVLSLRRELTPMGNVRFDADRTSQFGHADRAWALALAIHASGSVARETLTGSLNFTAVRSGFDRPNPRTM